MNCKNCGAKLDAGALFCRKCGTAAPATPEPEPKKDLFSRLKGIRLKDNRRFLLTMGAALLLVAVLVIVIVSAASCQGCAGSKKFASPDDVRAAVVDALERGDGKSLGTWAKLSEPVLGAHPETFGEGDTPHAVMQGYYDRLAGNLHTELSEWYGDGFALESETETRILSGSEIFEPNRALNIEASQYAEITGVLTVEGEAVREIRIAAVELNGEWKLLAVYVY